MSYSDTMSFCLTLVAIALAPGPVALVILVRAVGRDTWGAVGFSIGYSLGGFAIVATVCFGLGAFLSTVPEIFEYCKYLMLAYMLWLAHGIWKGGFDMTGARPAKSSTLPKSVSAGFLTSMISPYNMILFPLMLPDLLDITRIELPEFAIVGSLSFLSFFAGCVILIVFAAQITRIVKSPIGMQRLNRVLAGILAMAGSWMTFA